MNYPNALTEKQRCRADCPRGNHAFMERGEVVRCEHGEVFIVKTDWVRWSDRGRDAFSRLSPFWDRRLYRRALEALAVESCDDGDE